MSIESYLSEAKMAAYACRERTEPQLLILRDPKGLAKVLCWSPTESEPWNNFKILQYLGAAFMSEVDQHDPLWRHKSLYELATEELDLNVPDIEDGV